MLKRLKRDILATAKTAGIFSLFSQSQWRRNRLLIIAYHGIALDDEHLWNPALFVSPEFFEARLRTLQKYGCTVLGLGDAVNRLLSGELPERSVVLTFDDGNHDFCERAYPLLARFRYPATVYLTSFYSEFQKPVFDVMVSYVLWKARDSNLNLAPLIGREEICSLASESSRESAV